MAKNRTERGKERLQKEMLWSKKWARTRIMGMTKYILIYGVLMWGLLTSLVFQLISMYSKGFHYTNIVAELVSPTISLMIAGLLFGTSTWLSSENKYNKIVSNNGRYVDKGKKNKSKK